jgi:hypothetical protein
MNAPETGAGSNPLNGLVFALGVLIILSQATERLMVVLRKLATYFGWEWAGPQSDEERKDTKESGKRAMLLNTYAVFVGLFVAFVSRVDILTTATKGQLSLVAGSWWVFDWPPERLLGVVLTGLIASMGSAFLNDLLAVVQAVKEVQRAAVGKAPAGAAGGQEPPPGK